MSDDKILKRIKDLLAMAKSTSPKEAAIAAGRARKLMDKHQVSELDLTQVKSNDFSETKMGTGQKTINRVESILSLAVAKLNDCHVIYGGSRRTEITLVFKGMFSDSVCATILFEYLRDEGKRLAVKNEMGRADRFAYRLGFAAGVAEQIDEILEERSKLITSDSTALVACKQAMVESHYGVQEYKSTTATFSGNYGAFQSGEKAGKNANLSRHVSGESQKTLDN